MVTIRLTRGGAKKQPFYHIVATDSRARRDGKYIERLGFYNPVTRASGVAAKIDLARVDHWIGHGAQMSERVSKIVKSYRKDVEAGGTGTGDALFAADKHKSKRKVGAAPAPVAAEAPAAEVAAEEAPAEAEAAAPEAAADGEAAAE